MVSNTVFFNALLAQSGLKDGNDTAALLNLIGRVNPDLKPLDVFSRFGEPAKEAVRKVEPHYRKMLGSEPEAGVAKLGVAKMAYVYMILKDQLPR